MHQEIQSDAPGRCPKCGMTLVLKSEIKTEAIKVDPQGLGPITWRSYLPLIVIIAIIIAAALITSRNNFTAQDFIIKFMTGFFSVFAGFKLMDLKGFAEGYSTYDLLASKWFGYGFIYPFLELAFGLLMLAGYHPLWLLWAELILMAFSGLGVAIKLARREPFMCACLGTFLKVPLTYVTLIEDFGMAVLALILIMLLK